MDEICQESTIIISINVSKLFVGTACCEVSCNQ